MYQLIYNFIKSIKEIDNDIFPFLANKKNFNPETDSVYYSGPYWDDEEISEMIHSILKGKWLSSGEKVHKFEKQFSGFPRINCPSNHFFWWKDSFDIRPTLLSPKKIIK